VVEDDPLIRFAMSETLRHNGLIVAEAADAGEAIDLIEHDPSIHVIFSDIQMPGEMDGIGLALWLAKHRPNADVILTSGNPAKSDIAVRACGRALFFAKPYDMDMVANRIGWAAAQH
jgi:CheY-like chemotaxis protein